VKEAHLSYKKLLSAALKEQGISSSPLERRFETEWRQIGGPPYEAGFAFHPSRKWEFDCAWPAVKIALELEGGTYSSGRHVRGAGYAGDCEKYNEAALLGWFVFRLTTDMLDTHTLQIERIRDYIKRELNK